MTDYADHPISFAERRAENARDGSLWTPRDALVAMLRDIDSGKLKPASLVIAYHFDTPEVSPTAYRVGSYNATPSLLHCVGLMEEAKNSLMNG